MQDSDYMTKIQRDDDSLGSAELIAAYEQGIEDLRAAVAGMTSEQVAALALQGPTSGKLLRAVTDANIANLKYFRVTHGKIAGVAVDPRSPPLLSSAAHH